MSIPIATTWILIPKLDYLPPVKRDAVDSFVSFPPGSNIETIENELVEPIVERMSPYMSGEKEPALKNYYILVGPWGMNVGARAKDQSRVKELEQVVRDQVMVGFPDTRAFVYQGNLFGNSTAIATSASSSSRLMRRLFWMPRVRGST